VSEERRREKDEDEGAFDLVLLEEIDDGSSKNSGSG
jgi:hypothetical protein